jgi:hypothetical protein
MALALRPGCNEAVVKTVAWYPILCRNIIDNNTKRYSWSAAQCCFVWFSIFAGLLLLILPVSFISLTIYALLAYLWIALVPVVAITYHKNTSNRFQVTRAYAIKTQLKQGWADHGQAFYRQIWSHNCNDQYSDYGSCRYCLNRYDELEKLLKSQQSVEENYAEPINNELFESSAQFRAAVAKQFDPDPLMKEISDKASEELEYDYLPSRLKNKLVRRT